MRKYRVITCAIIAQIVTCNELSGAFDMSGVKGEAEKSIPFTMMSDFDFHYASPFPEGT